MEAVRLRQIVNFYQCDAGVLFTPRTYVNFLGIPSVRAGGFARDARIVKSIQIRPNES